MNEKKLDIEEVKDDEAFNINKPRDLNINKPRDLNITASYSRALRNLDKELERKLSNEHKGSIKNYDWSGLYKCVDIGDNCY